MWSPSKFVVAKNLKMWQSTQNFVTRPISELRKWFCTFWKWHNKLSTIYGKMDSILRSANELNRPGNCFKFVGGCYNFQLGKLLETSKQKSLQNLNRTFTKFGQENVFKIRPGKLLQSPAEKCYVKANAINFCYELSEQYRLGNNFYWKCYKIWTWMSSKDQCKASTF